MFVENQKHAKTSYRLPAVLFQVASNFFLTTILLKSLAFHQEETNEAPSTVPVAVGTKTTTETCLFIFFLHQMTNIR